MEQTLTMPRRTYYTKPPSAAEKVRPEHRHKEFAARLNRAMLNKGWSQSELARRATQALPAQANIGSGGKPEIGRHLVSSYIRGVHMPTQVVLETLAKVLGVKVEDLVPETEAEWVSSSPAPFTISASAQGNVRLKIDMDLPLDVALEIAALLKKA